MVGSGRQMDAAAINWTQPVIDHLNPSFLNFDRKEIGKEISVIRVLTSPNASEGHVLR
jgi:hypothetical protein